MERDDDAGVGKRLQVELAVAAGGRHRGEKTQSPFRSHTGRNADAASGYKGVPCPSDVRVGERWRELSHYGTLFSLVPWCPISTASRVGPLQMTPVLV